LRFSPPIGDADDENQSLAAVMEWRPGTIVADIGAGDGSTLCCGANIGSSAKSSPPRLTRTSSPNRRPKLQAPLANVRSSKQRRPIPISRPNAATHFLAPRLPPFDYKPAEFDAALIRSLKPGGRLAVIEFPPRSSLDRWKACPQIVAAMAFPRMSPIQELTAAGFHIKTTVNSWPQGDYLLLFLKKSSNPYPTGVATVFTVFWPAHPMGTISRWYAFRPVVPTDLA